MWFEDFQNSCHGGHLGYQNRTILAILNLHVAPMPSTKFWLHPTYRSRADNKWFSRWIRFWWRCWKCEKLLMDIRMMDGPWSTDHGMLTRSKAPGELTTEDLQDGCCGHLRRYRNKMFLAILNLHVTPMPRTKFWLNPTYHLADKVWRFSRWPPWRPSLISEQNGFSNSESLCRSNSSHQVWNEFSSSEYSCLPNASYQVSA